MTYFTMNRFLQILYSVSFIFLFIGINNVAFSEIDIKENAGYLSKNSQFDSAHLDEAIMMSAGYLKKNCDINGKFTYRVNIDPAVKVFPKYNILRHAGAIYALATYEQRTKDKEALDTLIHAVRFLKKNTIKTLSERDDMLAVWSNPEINLSKAPYQAKLGGAGLGLVALLSMEKIKQGTTSIDVLRKIGRFILYMKKSDGSFYSKFIPSRGGRNDQWTSLYYPGEAAFGLLMLYEKDPHPQWLQGAAESIAYLARIREGRDIVEADHWALLATAKLLPLYNLCRQPIPRKRVLQHALQICKSMLIDIPECSKEPNICGSLSRGGTTCPTATRLEGLLAALTFLPDEQRVFRRKIKSVVSNGISFLLRSQVSSGKYVGGIPRAIGKLPSIHPSYSEKFNERATEIRIDYVQHALSAMIQYSEFFQIH